MPARVVRGGADGWPCAALLLLLIVVMRMHPASVVAFTEQEHQQELQPLEELQRLDPTTTTTTLPNSHAIHLVPTKTKSPFHLRNGNAGIPFSSESSSSLRTLMTSFQDEPACWRSEVYNPDTDVDHTQRVVGKTGLVFYLGSKVKPIHLQTLEIAVDSQIPDLDYDWRIRIYISNATYDEQDFAAIQSTFVQIADTTAVLHPDGDRVVIPTTAFGPKAGSGVLLGRLDRRIFYIRAAGPWLTYTTNAMAQPKDQGRSGPRMTLFVGSPLPFNPMPDNGGTGDNPFALPSNDAMKGGFDDAGQAFPSTLDTSLRIIFSGRWHLQYERDVCTNRNPNDDNQGQVEPPPPLTTETALELTSIVNATLAAPDYRRIEQAVNAQVDQFLQTNAVLQPYVQSANLRMPDSSKALFRNFVGQCNVPGWTACQFLIVKLVFQHDTTLSSGTIQEQIYASAVADFSQGAILPSLPATANIGAAYLGYTTVQTRVHITLQGVPARTKLDAVQQAFVSQALVDWWNAQLEPIYSQVFQIAWDNQIFVNNRRQRELTDTHHNDPRQLANTDSLQVSGMLTGGNIVVEEVAEFATRLNQVLEEQPTAVQYLVQSLQYQAQLPGAMAEQNRHDFFTSLHSLEAFVDGSVTQPPSGTGGSTGGIGGTGGTGGGGTNSGNPEGNSEGEGASLVDSVTQGLDWWILAAAGAGLIAVLLGVWMLVRCWCNAPGKRQRHAEQQQQELPEQAPPSRRSNKNNNKKGRGRRAKDSPGEEEEEMAGLADYNYASTRALPMPGTSSDDGESTALHKKRRKKKKKKKKRRRRRGEDGVSVCETVSVDSTAEETNTVDSVSYFSQEDSKPPARPSPPPPQRPPHAGPPHGPTRAAGPPVAAAAGGAYYNQPQAAPIRRGPPLKPPPPSWSAPQQQQPLEGAPPETPNTPRKTLLGSMARGLFGDSNNKSKQPEQQLYGIPTLSPPRPSRNFQAGPEGMPPPMSPVHSHRSNLHGSMTSLESYNAGLMAPPPSGGGGPAQHQHPHAPPQQAPPPNVATGRTRGPPPPPTSKYDVPESHPLHPPVSPVRRVVGRQRRESGAYTMRRASTGPPPPPPPVLNAHGTRVNMGNKYDLAHDDLPMGGPPPPVVVGRQRRVSGGYQAAAPSKPMNIRGSMTHAPPQQQQQQPFVPPAPVVGRQRRESGGYSMPTPSRPMNVRGSMTHGGPPPPQRVPPPHSQQQPPPPPPVVGRQRRESGGYTMATPARPMNVRGSMTHGPIPHATAPPPPS